MCQNKPVASDSDGDSDNQSILSHGPWIGKEPKSITAKLLQWRLLPWEKVKQMFENFDKACLYDHKDSFPTPSPKPILEGMWQVYGLTDGHHFGYLNSAEWSHGGLAACDDIRWVYQNFWCTIFTWESQQILLFERAHIGQTPPPMEPGQTHLSFSIKLETDTKKYLLDILGLNPALYQVTAGQYLGALEAVLLSKGWVTIESIPNYKVVTCNRKGEVFQAEEIHRTRWEWNPNLCTGWAWIAIERKWYFITQKSTEPTALKLVNNTDYLRLARILVEPQVLCHVGKTEEKAYLQAQFCQLRARAAVMCNDYSQRYWHHIVPYGLLINALQKLHSAAIPLQDLKQDLDGLSKVSRAFTPQENTIRLCFLEMLQSLFTEAEVHHSAPMSLLKREVYKFYNDWIPIFHSYYNSFATICVHLNKEEHTSLDSCTEELLQVQGRDPRKMVISGADWFTSMGEILKEGKHIKVQSLQTRFEDAVLLNDGRLVSTNGDLVEWKWTIVGHVKQLLPQDITFGHSDITKAKFSPGHRAGPSQVLNKKAA